MPATKIGSRWISGLLEFFRNDTKATVLKVTESGIEANVIGDVTGNLTGNVSGYALKSVAVTAAASPGAAIPAGATHVVVTSDHADKIVILPAPVVGLKITLINGATGYELRSSAPGTIGINGGVSAAGESAIGANEVIKMECVSATNWIGASVSAAGVIGVVQVAAD